MTSRNFNSRRYLDLAFGVMAVLFAPWLAGCDGTEPGVDGAGPEWPVPGSGPHVSGAGVTYCDIPSPSGDVRFTLADGTKSQVTMRQQYYGAAEAGSTQWGVVGDAGDYMSVCMKNGGAASTCEAGTRDLVRYCFVLKCVPATGQENLSCSFSALYDPTDLYTYTGLGTWDGDSRRVYGPLCDPQGRFVGWSCQLPIH